MGAFVNAISALFVYFHPDAIIPSLGLIVVAMGVGSVGVPACGWIGPAPWRAWSSLAGLIVWGVAQPFPTHEWFTSRTRAALDADRIVRR